MSNRSELSRRGFIKGVALSSAGFMLGCTFLRTDTDGNEVLLHKSPPSASALGVWITIDPTGIITILVSKPDIGQGTRTSMAMLVAEELDVDWTSVRVVQSPTNSGLYGSQGVGGSGSVRGMYNPLRQAGAAARAMLIAAAAKQWGCATNECSTKNGVVLGPGGKTAKYGTLAEAAMSIDLPDGESIQLKDPSSFTIIGKPTKRIDNADIVTGKAVFGQDFSHPAMKVAVVKRPVAFGARVRSFDDSAASKVEGVTKVMQLGSGVAVVANSTHAAFKGREALKVEFEPGAEPNLDSAALLERMKATVVPFPELPASGKLVEASFQLPFLAHATMEPMNALAHVTDGKCEIWCSTQVPDSVQAGVARQLGISAANVLVHVGLCGGGFGRRLNPDYVFEAVTLSKELGVPIKVMWSRDDDMKHDYYRPATFHKLRGAVGSSGEPIAWQHCSIMAGNRQNRREPVWGQARIPYEIGGAQFLETMCQCPVPIGAWRSVENTYMGFVNESFMDELAAAAGADSVAYRLKYLRNERLRRTLEVCAERARWEPGKKGLGVACFAGYGSFCTQIAEVDVSRTGVVKVKRLVSAVDCGVAVNPLGVEAQVEGSIMDGIACALVAEITLENGGVKQSSFRDFEWSHMADTPQMEVHIIPSREAPGGMGEVAYPAVAPAVANAVFSATGKRCRNLPIRKV